MSTTLESLRVKIFADGANLSEMLDMNAKSYIKGLTTNPTLMRKAGVTNYKAFAQEVLAHIREKPVAFEVLSDEFHEMERQALELASWGDNVYVKLTGPQGSKALGIWTTHIALLKGQEVGPSDLRCYGQ